MEKKRNQHELQSSRRLYLKRAGGIDKNAFANECLSRRHRKKARKRDKTWNGINKQKEWIMVSTAGRDK